jgi:hypothetical protein
MKFFNLSLRHRLLLAIIPSFLLPLALVASVLIYGWRLDDEEMILVSIAYAALFGVFVMAPFITSPSRLILRIGALIAASILIPSAAILSLNWLVNSLIVAIIVVLVVLSALLLAAVLIIAAPLKVSGKYWIYIALAALVTSAVFLASIDWFLCFPVGISPASSCPWWYELALFVPTSVVWPLSFCTAVYFGRIDSKRVEQITTESERE